MNVKKLIILLSVGALAVTAGCGSQSDQKAASGDKALTGSVTASGSSALLPLAKIGAEDFKKAHPDVSITINGGGSGTGLKQVSDGTVQIGNSDVFAAEKLTKEKAAELKDHKVAVVTMATVANSSVASKVHNLTKAQLQDIFTGKITNWSAVGGPNLPVVLVTRPATSGTRALFTKYALDNKAEKENQALQTDDSGTLMQTIAQTDGAIGYVALSYLVKKNDKVGVIALDGIEPTLENTYNGKYPVWGYEHMYTKGEAIGAVKAYLDYMVSKDFGAKIEKLGYGAVGNMKVSRDS